MKKITNHKHADVIFTRQKELGLFSEIIQKCKPFTRSEQNELIKKIQTETDPVIQTKLAEKLFNHNIRFVVKVTKQQTISCPDQFQEALSLGAEGLWRCIIKKVLTGEFIPGETSFLTLAVKYIQGSILNKLPQLSNFAFSIPNRIYYLYLNMQRYRDDLFTRHEFDLYNVNDIPQGILKGNLSNSSLERIEKFYTKKVVSTSDCIHMKRCLDSENEFEVIPESVITSNQFDPQDIFKISDLEKQLEIIFYGLENRARFLRDPNRKEFLNNSRDADIFKHWVFNILEEKDTSPDGKNISFEEISSLYQITPERARQIVNKKLLVVRSVKYLSCLKEYL